MKTILVLCFSILVNELNAQESSKKKVQDRTGFAIGVGMGAGLLNLNSNDTNTTTFSTTIPNIKAGFMINKRLELLLMLPVV